MLLSINILRTCMYTIYSWYILTPGPENKVNPLTNIICIWFTYLLTLEDYPYNLSCYWQSQYYQTNVLFNFTSNKRGQIFCKWMNTTNVVVWGLPTWAESKGGYSHPSPKRFRIYITINNTFRDLSDGCFVCKSRLWQTFPQPLVNHEVITCKLQVIKN